jgi:hypothetical protein
MVTQTAYRLSCMVGLSYTVETFRTCSFKDMEKMCKTPAELRGGKLSERGRQSELGGVACWRFLHSKGNALRCMKGMDGVSVKVLIVSVCEIAWR